LAEIHIHALKLRPVMTTLNQLVTIRSCFLLDYPVGLNKHTHTLSGWTLSSK